MNKISVFIVEDHKLLRDAWREVFKTQDDILVIGEADNITQAYQEIELLKPQVVLIDINLKGESGSELIKMLKKSVPYIKLIVVSLHAEYVIVKKMFAYGINAYVTKYADSNNLFEAIRKVMLGEIYLSSDLQDLFMSRGMKNDQEIDITYKEIEIIKLICEGKSNKEMAKDLSVSLKTIEGHKTNIFKKLQIHSLAGIVKYAQEKGIYNR